MASSQYNKFTKNQNLHAEGWKKCFLLMHKISIFLIQTSHFI